MKRLLLDHGLPRSTPALLVQAGWDVTHVADIGMSRADDVDILQRARGAARLYHARRGLPAILATSGDPGPSVVRVRKEGLDAAGLADLLQEVWPGIEQALAAGAMVTLTDRAIRVRRLPVLKN